MKPTAIDQKLGRGAWQGLRKPLCFLALLAALPACATASPPAAAPAPQPPPPAPTVVAAPPPPASVPALADATPPPSDAAGDAADDPGSGEATEDETPDDEDTAADSATATAPATPSKLSSPLLALSEGEFQARFRKDPDSLGPLSVGRPNAGALVNGVQMPNNSTKWKVLEPGLAWGTQETVDGLSKAIEKVNNDFPGSPAIPIGHISSKHGGYLPVHKSHQAGRDVDVGYYFTTPAQQFISGTKANLDLPRTYAIIKTLFQVSDVEMLFMDTSIQKLLVDYGLSHGEDASWLDRMYQVRQKQGVFAPIRHVRGHKNHFHVRFSSPLAVALGRRVAGMVAIHPAPPPGTKGAVATSVGPGEKLVAHKCHNGDTLVILAKRYGTTVEAIQRANGLKGIALKAGHIYQIPVPAPVAKGAPLQKSAPLKSAPMQAKHAPKKGKTGG